MEIGSFIELDNNQSGEFYQTSDMVRLNAGRYGIFHAMRINSVKKIHIPYYLCPSVAKYLLSQGIEVEKYYLTPSFEPILTPNEVNSAVLIVNYFGIIPFSKLEQLTTLYRNVIIDNSQAFYSKPISSCLNVYSPRKFFGVPDGCYVIGDGVNNYTDDYEQDYSSDSALFLLKRIEYGCSEVYPERQKNEDRLDSSGIRKMSKLTNYLLRGIDYHRISKIRRSNFEFAHQLWGQFNKIDSLLSVGEEIVPMVYPLVVETESLMELLKADRVYTGRWWNAVLSEVDSNSFEAYLSKFMLPIPIDQRYDESTIELINDIIQQSIK